MSEENSYLYINSKLGPNKLLLESFTGSEGISRLFSFNLELLSKKEKEPIHFEKILGSEISFGVNGSEPGDPARCIHGIVTAFTRLSDTPYFSRYRATVAPKLWLITKKQNCRIFQNIAVPDILKKLLEGMDVAWELQGSYKPREYCVQYRETDFNFLSRLMQEEGIFYFFRHSENAHKLVISDSKTSHREISDQASLIYDSVAGGLREERRISSWIKTQELSSGACSLQDYSFENPKANLYATQPIRQRAMVGKVNHVLKLDATEKLEIYDYPGRYVDKGQGADIARHAMEQMELNQFVIQGESNVHILTPGYRFDLTRNADADGSYVLTSVEHTAYEGGFQSGDDIGQNQYSNKFNAIPFDLAYRPPHTADKPHVWGCQTAVVVGPSGEEIYVDKYGRVKVHFHWDRENQRDQSSSCWIRVATPWAGQNWGAIHLPRIGQEVVVDFLEGDPDRPIIMGSVYNAANMPPYTLPANKTQSGIITESSQGGNGCNQIRFEDKHGSEEMLIHAQKDMNTTVENNVTLEVKNNRKANIKADDQTTVGKKMNLTVQADRTTKINGKDSVTVNKDSSVTVLGSESCTIAKSRSTKVASSDTLTVGGSISITAAGGLTITAPKITLNAGMVQVSGAVQCVNLIASAGVVSPVYTPGAGNTM